MEQNINNCQMPVSNAIQEIGINDYLKTFRHFLLKINGDNVVLAGVNALKLHGLKMSRNPNDLDVVIFKPTKAQLDIN